MTLRPGEVVTGDDGVSLGATPGAIGDDVSIVIDRVDDVSSLPPLGDGVERVGDMYAVGSDRLLITPVETPLLVGLPIPPERLGDNLQVAVLSSALGDRSGEPRHQWSATEGTYDAESELFLIPLYSLSMPDDGIILTIVDAGEPAAQPTRDALETQAEVVGRFAAKCNIKFEDGDCTAEEEEDAARIANDFYISMVTARGFKKPLIRPLLVDVKASLIPPSFSASVDAAQYLVDLQLDDRFECIDRGGRYILPLAKVYVCLPPEDRNNIITVTEPGPPVIVFPGHEGTIRHEVFHAIQWTYGGVTSSGFGRNVFWPLIEGGANASENSRAEMHTNGSDRRHPVDASLSREAFRVGTRGLDYDSQDFWVFVGRVNDVGIEYFQTLYSGPTLVNRDVDTGFKILFGDSYGLSEAYWDWAKNQAFESRVTAGDLGVNGPCVINPDVIDEIPEPTGGDPLDLGALPTITYDPFGDTISGFNEFLTELEPLQARVYRFFLLPASEGTFANIRIRASNNDIKVKFYEDYASPTTACHADPDSKEYVTPVGQDPKYVYMLVANTSLTDTLSGFASKEDVSIETIQPGITIVEPEDTAIFPEGEIVSFEAELDNPLAADVTIRWLVDGTEASTVNSETFGAQFCPGDHAITAVAEFRGQGDTATVTDEIIITIENNVPQVDILEAPNSIGVNNDFALVGSVRDVTCTDTRGTAEVDLDRLIWTVEDGFGGSGPGILSSFSEQGTKTVTLSYTDESGAASTDTRTVSVGSYDPNADPVVVVKEPQEGAFIDLDRRADLDYVIDTVGQASSSISDGELFWSYRAEGASTWQDFDTGRTGTLRLPVPIDNDKTYVVRLEYRNENIESRRSITLEAVVQ